MFYRIKDDKLYDYSDNIYRPDCLKTDITTQSELDKYPNKVIVQDGELVLNPNWSDIELQQAKQTKYQEANSKANEFLQSGEALYEFEEGKHIEATDGNIAKMTAYALAYVTGQLQPTDTVVWNTKEDETVNLNQAQIVAILNGLGNVQAVVWSVQYPVYVSMIESATTVEEVEAIVIDYTTPINEVEND